MNSFWGGAVPALGGALALGGLGRILKRPFRQRRARDGTRNRHLSNSRPYEGMLFSLPVGAVFLWCSLERQAGGFLVGSLLQSGFASGASSCGKILPSIGYYNWRATGSPRTLRCRSIKVLRSERHFHLETPGPPMHTKVPVRRVLQPLAAKSLRPHMEGLAEGLLRKISDVFAHVFVVGLAAAGAGSILPS